MPYQLKPLFSGERTAIPVGEAVDLSGETMDGRPLFETPVQVEGTIRSIAGGLAVLELSLRYDRRAACARCLKELTVSDELDIRHVLTMRPPEEDGRTAGEDGGSDADVLCVPDGLLDITELVRDGILLALPFKTLCREDCRGLCQYCGRDLNESLCGCRGETVDPRLAVLKSLLDE